MEDILSFIMGMIKGTQEGAGNVVLDGDYNFTDPNHDGNIVITKKDGE